MMTMPSIKAPRCHLTEQSLQHGMAARQVDALNHKRRSIWRSAAAGLQVLAPNQGLVGVT